MPRFYIIFDESNKDDLTNSDASAHLVNFVDVESEDQIYSALYLKIRKSDRSQISSKSFKIKSYRKASDN